MDFSSYKTWRNIAIAVIAIGAIIYFVSPSEENKTPPEENKTLVYNIPKEKQLLEKGKEFILRQVNSPSTTIFLSYSDEVKGILTEWGVKLEEKHDALLIEFETTNALGGRIRKSLCIFYLNGIPVDYADASDLNRATVHQYISIMKEKGLW